ncbi:MAG: hypothetical protein CMM04_16750 [Rhodopirellula sp.]|mgnify:CR=1 FL=1|nr:hypothetical protein [Rhodopirellula sp.]|tara:strand:+ start:5630 stop:5860 length:231 start_codon:yes stop_codon:yes gene_type:complete
MQNKYETPESIGYKPSIKFHIAVERKFVEVRGILAKKMKDKDYSVDQIAKTLKTSQSAIYSDLRKIMTEDRRFRND